jgi:hypothetical protein
VKLDQLTTLVEKLRKAAIGEPLWVVEKEVFEYQDRSAKVAAVLKLVRAAHGVSAIDRLCRAGLFIDFGALIRCVNDSVSEIYFLLEEFPGTSGNVDQFIAEFFARTIDGYLSDETAQVPTNETAQVPTKKSEAPLSAFLAAVTTTPRANCMKEYSRHFRDTCTPAIRI